MTSITQAPLDLSYKRILGIAAPVLIANLALPLQGSIDVAVVGHFPHSYSLAGLGIASQLWLLILVSFNFLQYASSGLAAQATGRKSTMGHSNNELADILYRSLGLAVVLGLILWLIKPFIIAYGLKLLGANTASLQAADTYLNIRYYGIFFELMNYAFIGWFAGQGKTNQMMMVQLLISMINIVLTLFFVYQMDLGLKGVALGTVIGYATGCLLAFFLAHYTIKQEKQLSNGLSSKHAIKTTNKRNRLTEIYSVDQMLKLFSLNKDIFIRTLLLTLSFAWITRMAAQQGDLVMATNALLLQVLSISSFALDGVAVAAESLSGQAVARRKQSQFFDAVKRTGIVVFCLALILSSIWLLALPRFLSIMTDLAPVYALAIDYRYAAALLPFAGAGAYWLDGVMFGLTDGPKIRRVAILVAAIFFPVTWFLYHQFADLYAMPIIWFSIYWLLVSRCFVAAMVLWKDRHTVVCTH